MYLSSIINTGKELSVIVRNESLCIEVQSGRAGVWR